MCNTFSCKYSYLELTDSGDTALYCSQHDHFLHDECAACFFSSCDCCRKRSGSCHDAAFQYFNKVVLEYGKKLQSPVV